jgi:NAD(P)-dependent dehydrogenase (short-subunit alcohol dehydrogenase family)
VIVADPQRSAGRITRRVLVTGSHPLALGVARWFAASGARVALMAAAVPESPPAGNSSDAPEPEFVACSFESEDEVEAAVRATVGAIGGVDQVVHAWVADGLVDACAFIDIDESRWIDACEASLEGAWWLTRRVIEPLRAAGGGTIVYLVPSVGLSGAANYSMLATVAEGIRVLAKGVGRQWVKHGVTSNTIATAPGLWVGAENEEALARAISLAVPAFGRAGDAFDDLAPLTSMLAEPESHFISAATLVADGAVWMGL